MGLHSFKQKLDKIDLLQNQISAHSKFSKDLLNRINNKFRLDWNYYSNRMEGNTLTLEETKSVMTSSINVHNKPFKDVLEMKGHDETIRLILKMGKGELNISEARIKEIHTSIIYEENPKKQHTIGNWKDQNNHVINYKGEKFDFRDFKEIPDAMHELVNWVNTEKEKIIVNKSSKLHPVELAFEFHLRYLTIHPFIDGNGRTARILTNLILISNGYPPVYIKDEDKRLYYNVLADVQGYHADKYHLFVILSEYLIRSLEIVQAAIDGKDIEEPEDLDKKIRLLEQKLNVINQENEVQLRYSKEVFLQAFDTWINNFLISLMPTIQKFNNLFVSYWHILNIIPAGIGQPLGNIPIYEVVEQLLEKLKVNNRLDNHEIEMQLNITFRAFKKGGLDSFNYSNTINILFEEFKYTITFHEFNQENNQREIVKIERLLHQVISEKEIKDIVQRITNGIFNEIEYKVKERVDKMR